MHSRLLSSKFLAKQVADSVLSLKALLDPSIKTSGTKATTFDVPHEVGMDDEVEESEINAVGERPAKRSKAVESSGKEDDDLEQPDDDGGWESGTVDGASDPDPEGWESGSIEQSEEDSDSDSGLVVPSSSNKAKKLPSNPQPTSKVNESKSTSSSTFLPSLSVGFIRGNSSDSDIDEDGADGQAGDIPKKNRRGQRARRAYVLFSHSASFLLVHVTHRPLFSIWEKKFGRNANHKKQEGASEQQNAIQNAYAQRKGRSQAKGTVLSSCS